MKWNACLILVLLAVGNGFGQSGSKISPAKMKEIYEEVKTPYKYGLVMVPGDEAHKMDCPTIFREGKFWYMTYLVYSGRGYETYLAKSKDLLHWEQLGSLMSFGDSGHWDDNQKAGYNALLSTEWGGSYKLTRFDGKYWMSYFGGKEKGYETEPLSIGMAYTSKKPWLVQEWTRLPEPVLKSSDADVRWWENRNKLFKSTVVEDAQKLTGHRFVMYYNAVGDSLVNNKKTRWYERIGMAVSDDMLHWKRFGKDPVVHHPVGITGDGVVQKIKDTWVMFYFGAFWQDRKGSFNRFAASKDLVNWTDWTGENLIESSEEYDELYAHKSCVIKYQGVVYHFYCAVNNKDQRGIAVATSRDLGKSNIEFIGRAQPRVRESFNQNWKFFLGDEPAAKSVDFNDSKWRILNLPHDWSIEGKFDEKNPAKPEGGGLPTGIAWYRKSFSWSPGVVNEFVNQVFIEFDGVYKNSEVWINGHFLGKRPYGYSSFRYALVPYLKAGRNVVSVRVDNSAQPDSRWYSGSGIYRNVWLEQTSGVAVDHWGTFVSTPMVSKTEARISFKTQIRNSGRLNTVVDVQSLVYDAKGKLVTSVKTEKISLKDTLTSLQQFAGLTNPQLWSVKQPHLYKVITKIFTGKELSDQYETPLGIRYFNFDAKSGFSLNGENLKILGVCLHHDLGALGAAVNVRAIERQLAMMRDMGCNAIRTAHNPPAPELLDLCDKMGFLVMDEAFDMWKKKKNSKDYHLNWAEWHRKDLGDMVKRDRNHPSVILWSIGNEIREQFDSTGVEMTKELVKLVKDLDTSRLVVSALTETDAKKNFIYQAGALDIYGLNYNHKLYKDFPKNYPGQKFLATETTSSLDTRGFYEMPSDSIRRWPKDGKTKFTEGNTAYSASSYDNVSAYWGSTHEETWKEAKKYEHVSGLFVWTGFDYLGEPLPYPWPARSSYFGIVDLAGFPKDAYYMYQSEWTNKPVLHLFPHWNWPAGKLVDVWAYYNHADEVELFLNGKSLGKRSRAGEDLHVAWKVKYEAGTLKVVSRKNGRIVLEKEIHTAGRPAQLVLVADRSKIAADGKDLSFVTVKVLDAQGNVVPNADNFVQFKLEGPGQIAGVDNGFQASLEPFKADSRKAFHGLCLAIIQSADKAGSLHLTASSTGLRSATLKIQTSK
nr:beta-galactosidase GalB [Pedobacter sp. ASV19]